MKRIICIILLACFFLSLLFSEEKETQSCTPNSSSEEVNFSYFNFGISAFVIAPVPVPNVGFGWRHHKERFGFDICFWAAPYIFLNGFSLTPSINFYSKKDFYTGLGAGAGIIFTGKGYMVPHNELFFLPGFIIGKEFINKSNKRRFIQLNITCPIRKEYSDYLPFTFISLQYGIGF